MNLNDLVKLIDLHDNDVKLYAAIEPILGKGELMDVFEQVQRNKDESKQRLIEGIKQYALECVEAGLSTGLKKR